MNKFKILKTYLKERWLKKFKTREDVENYRNKMLNKHMKFLKDKSDYFKKLDFDSFEQLPYMNKDIMMKNFDTLNTVGIKKEEALELAINSEKTRDFTKKLNGISVGLSSGTSGHRGLFVLSDDEIESWVGMIVARVLPHNNIFKNKVAFFLRSDNNLYEGTNKIMKFKYFDILKDMDKNVYHLDEFKPTILVAPPSVLMILAKYAQDGKLKINPIKVISVAEVLTNEDSEYLKKVFNQKYIFQIYQCTEGFLGYTCECGSLHINEDVVYIEKEYIDEKRFIPIVTDFFRTTQPIIRYRLNDILVESDKKCECGSPFMVIEKIEGRMDDVFLFDGKNKEVNVFPDFISRCIIYVPGIREYKVYQKSKKDIIVYLDNLDFEIMEKINQEFEKLANKMNFEKPNIEFLKYQSNLSKKMKRIERGF